MPAWTDEDVRRLQGLHATGATLSQIARHIGCSRSAVHSKLMKLQLSTTRKPPKEPKLWNAAEIAKLAACRDDGISIRLAATRLGRSQQDVKDQLARMSLPRS